MCFIMQTLSSFNKPRSSSTILLRQADSSHRYINTHTYRISLFLHNDDYVWKCWSCWIKGMLLCWAAGPCIVRLKAAPFSCNQSYPRVYKRTKLITEQSTAQHSYYHRGHPPSWSQQDERETQWTAGSKASGMKTNIQWGIAWNKHETEGARVEETLTLQYKKILWLLRSHETQQWTDQAEVGVTPTHSSKPSKQRFVVSCRATDAQIRAGS